MFFFFSSRRRHTRFDCDWSSDVCSSDLFSFRADYSENDKSALKEKQQELLRLILPAYRDAASRGQIEISTTPFYHPILPLICDSDVARIANPGTPRSEERRVGKSVDLGG